MTTTNWDKLKQLKDISSTRLALAILAVHTLETGKQEISTAVFNQICRDHNAGRTNQRVLIRLGVISQDRAAKTYTINLEKLHDVIFRLADQLQRLSTQESFTKYPKSSIAQGNYPSFVFKKQAFGTSKSSLMTKANFKTVSDSADFLLDIASDLKVLRIMVDVREPSSPDPPAKPFGATPPTVKRTNVYVPESDVNKYLGYLRNTIILILARGLLPLSNDGQLSYTAREYSDFLSKRFPTVSDNNSMIKNLQALGFYKVLEEGRKRIYQTRPEAAKILRHFADEFLKLAIHIESAGPEDLEKMSFVTTTFPLAPGLGDYAGTIQIFTPDGLKAAKANPDHLQAIAGYFEDTSKRLIATQTEAQSNSAAVAKLQALINVGANTTDSSSNRTTTANS